MSYAQGSKREGVAAQGNAVGPAEGKQIGVAETSFVGPVEGKQIGVAETSILMGAEAGGKLSISGWKRSR